MKKEEPNDDDRNQNRQSPILRTPAPLTISPATSTPRTEATRTETKKKFFYNTDQSVSGVISPIRGNLSLATDPQDGAMRFFRVRTDLEPPRGEPEPTGASLGATGGSRSAMDLTGPSVFDNTNERKVTFKSETKDSSKDNSKESEKRKNSERRKDNIKEETREEEEMEVDNDEFNLPSLDMVDFEDFKRAHPHLFNRK